jgi:hypothetical protein
MHLVGYLYEDTKVNIGFVSVTFVVTRRQQHEMVDASESRSSLSLKRNQLSSVPHIALRNKGAARETNI